MRARMSSLAAVSWLTAALPAGAVAPVPVPHAVAAISSGYVVSEVYLVEGGTLTLVNADATLDHDLVSEDFVPGTGQRRFRTSGPVAPGGTAAVVGVETLEAGDTRPFLCSLHEFMRGNVYVVAAPAV